VAFRISTTRKSLGRFDAAENIAGAVTFSAMPRPFDQVGAPVVRGVSGGIGGERPGVEEQELPDAQAPADIKRKWLRVRLGWCRLRRHGLQESIEITDVVE
jgi:hypothetical protein